MDRARVSSVVLSLALVLQAILGAVIVLPLTPNRPDIGDAAGSTAIRDAARPAPVVAPLAGWWQLPTPGSDLGNLTGSQMAYDSEAGYVLLFGGCPATTGAALYGCASPSNETWTYSNGTWSQLHPSVSPPGRYFGMMADDPAAGYVLLYGGANSTGVLNDTWAFSTGNWVQLHPSHSPPALEEAGLAYDRLAAEEVLFGGLTSGALNGSFETWTFVNGDWVNWTESAHPPGWVSPTMAPDPAGGVLLHGGISALFFPTYDQQTWTFGEYAWTNVTSTSGPEPPPSVLYSLATFDPVRNETLLFGGGDSTEIPYGTWAYNSSGHWNEVLQGYQGPPGGFYETGAAYDARDNYTVEFGEETIGSFYGLPEIDSVTNSTWVALSSLFINGTRVNGTLKPAANDTFSANVSGGVGPYQFHWSFDDGTFSNRSQPVHTFARTGSFEVNLTVTDRVNQSANATVFVNVSAPSSGLPVTTILILGAGVGSAIAAASAGVLLSRGKRPGGPGGSPTAETSATRNRGPGEKPPG